MSTSLVAPTGTEDLPPLLLTVEQAARMLAISRSAVYRLTWGGDLTPIHIGRSVRFAVAELERFIAERAAEPR